MDIGSPYAFAVGGRTHTARRWPWSPPDLTVSGDSKNIVDHTQSHPQDQEWMAESMSSCNTFASLRRLQGVAGDDDTVSALADGSKMLDVS